MFRWLQKPEPNPPKPPPPPPPRAFSEPPPPPLAFLNALGDIFMCGDTRKPRNEVKWGMARDEVKRGMAGSPYGDAQIAVQVPRVAPNKVDPRSSEALTIARQGLALNDKGDFRNALLSFYHAMRLDCSKPNYFISAGNMHLKLHEFEDALLMYERAQKLPLSPYQTAMLNKKVELASNALRIRPSAIAEAVAKIIPTPAPNSGPVATLARSPQSPRGTPLPPLLSATPVELSEKGDENLEEHLNEEDHEASSMVQRLQRLRERQANEVGFKVMVSPHAKGGPVRRRTSTSPEPATSTKRTTEAAAPSADSPRGARAR